MVELIFTSLLFYQIGIFFPFQGPCPSALNYPRNVGKLVSYIAYKAFMNMTIEFPPNKPKWLGYQSYDSWKAVCSIATMNRTVYMCQLSGRDLYLLQDPPPRYAES